MNRSSRLAAFSVGAALLTALAAAPASAAIPLKTYLIVDDDNAATIGDGTNSRQCGDAITVPNVTFSTINAAAAYASANTLDAIIYVCTGTYNENVTITSTLELRGPQAYNLQTQCRTRRYLATVIGTGSGPAITVNADTVKVAGMRIANTRGAGISVTSTSDDVRIVNNLISGNAVGIDLSGSGDGVVRVARNCITDNNNGGPGSGIAQTSAGLRNAVISWNRFADHRAPAIDLKEGSDISDVRIVDNRSWNDKQFVRLDGVSDVVVRSNITHQSADISFESSSIAAITVKGASSAITVATNRINTNHPRGILVDGPATGVAITGNRLTSVGNGVVINSLQAGAATVTGNRTVDILGTAFLFAVGTNGNTISDNTIDGIANFACQDASIGAGTDGTGNTWSDNLNPLGWASDPSGICPQTE